MNKIVSTFLLAGDTFIPETHLKPGFTYSACDSFTKNKKRIQNFKQTGNTNHIYKNDLDQFLFQHDMAYGRSNDLIKRTESDKDLREKAFTIASNPKYNEYERGLVSMIYKFFDKKFERRKVYSFFKYNTWGADLADM